MSSLAGVGLKILSTFLFAIMVAIIKHLSETVPTGEIVFSRCFFALIPLFVMSIMQRRVRECFETVKPWLHLRRSLVGASAMACWFLALKYLPLPEATAISFAAPLVVVALAALWLKEEVKVYRWMAVVFGFVGVLIILYPRLAGEAVAGDRETLGAFLAATATLLMAIASILVRQMTATERNASIIFYFFVATSLLSLTSLPWGWVMPDFLTMVLLVLSGLFGGLAQIAMTQAFRLTEASLLAPFDYVNMIWAIAIGLFLFDEVPNMEVIAGGSIVIGAGLFVALRERYLGLRNNQNRRLSEF